MDATHSVQQPGGQGASSGGQREFVPVLSRAAMAVGISGIFMETHPDPSKALSDGPNAWPLDKMRALLETLKEIEADGLYKREREIASEQYSEIDVVRNGQTDHVIVYRYVAEGTIEEKVLGLQRKKAELFDDLMTDELADRDAPLRNASGQAFSQTIRAEDIRQLFEG